VRDTVVQRSRIRRAWLILLAGCSLWLVVQNALLAVALLWSMPGPVSAITGALAKTTALLVARLWSPWVAALAVGLALGVLVMGVMERTPREVRHG
jgi:hypothetical protein